MTYKEFKAGKRVRFFCISGAVTWVLFIVVMGFIRGWSHMLLLPITLATVYSYLLYKSIQKPLFLISGNELVITKLKKKVSAEKITGVKQVDNDRLELILKDELPVQLLLNELSREDRTVLKSSIDAMIIKNQN